MLHRARALLLLAGCTTWTETERVEPVEPENRPAATQPVVEAPRQPPATPHWSASRLSQDPERARIQLAIAEAALRGLFADNASGIQQDAKRVCIELFGRNPDAAFLERLRDLGRPVAPARAFRQNADHLLLHIGSMVLVDSTHAEVRGGYYEASLSASGNKLWLELRDGTWIVVRNEILMIS
jgi:hypothetical protein